MRPEPRHAAAEIGIPKVSDFNLGDNEGSDYFEVNQKRGTRWSAARGFLRPAMSRRNLEVVTGANGVQDAAALGQLAAKHGFLGSVGSDFHTPQQSWNPLGRSLKLPDCITPVWRGLLP